MDVCKLIVAAGAIAALIGTNQICFAASQHTVIATYLDSGDPGTPLSPRSNLINSTKVHCPRNLQSCTLAMIVMDELCNQGDGYLWQIVVTVDTIPVDGGTDQKSQIPCFTGNWSGAYTVAPGGHLVQLFTTFEAGNGPTQGHWSINYSVTTP
jgi:hypothetical protein